MSTTFQENLTTTVEQGFDTLRATMKTTDELARRRAFADYLREWMDFNKQNPLEVEKRSKQTPHSISDATVGKLLLAETKDDVMVSTILGIANGISRPPEEVFLAWLGRTTSVDTEAFKESDAANLWEQIEKLSNSEQKIYRRYIQMMIREILRT